MIRDFSYLVISDIHLGNRRNKTINIINNLNVYFDNFSNSSKFAKLDFIFIAGDLFDSLLDFSSNDVHEIIIWLSSLMRFCKRFNIRLRILEGTPSHDWKQSQISKTIFNISDIGIDFNYISTLHIEYHKELDIYILYVPDEWSADAKDIISQIKDIMSTLSIDKVDIAIMHGMFNYQAEYSPNSIYKHTEYEYLDIVRHYINIGHVHTFSVYERIIANGSFDRLAHGEEEEKGGVVCNISLNNSDTFTFIKNNNAKIFKTINIKSKDIDKSMFLIDRQLKNIPNDSYIRISTKKDNPIYIAIDELKNRYPFINFSKKADDDNNSDINVNSINYSPTAINYSPISITNENILKLLTDEINNKYSLTVKQLALLENTLTENLI